MTKQSDYRILLVGAHPDDCDLKCGGTTIKWTDRGDEVHFLSMTNGNTGHQTMMPAELAARRDGEARAAAAKAGAMYHCMDVDCGALVPTVELRRRMIMLIRELKPDLVITHRPNDYHPDHRYTSAVVQDSLYLVTVPGQLPHSPHMRDMPSAMYFSDNFTRPYPFTPAIAVAIDDVMDRKVEVLHCHESQMYEWLPYNRRQEAEVPADAEGRMTWLAISAHRDAAHEAERCRHLLPEGVKYAESFEECEYGRRLPKDELAAMFPK